MRIRLAYFDDLMLTFRLFWNFLIFCINGVCSDRYTSMSTTKTLRSTKVSSIGSEDRDVVYLIFDLCGDLCDVISA